VRRLRLKNGAGLKTISMIRPCPMTGRYRLVDQVLESPELEAKHEVNQKPSALGMAFRWG
jgi:hypothetical protein